MRQRSTKVPPEGNPQDCILALVGEQPGRTEVRQRRPFCGPAGIELDSCLNTAGIPRSQCYLTNTFKDLDYPLEYYFKADRGRVALSNDGKEYVEELRIELGKCTANVIVAIGNPALYALTNRVGITSWRGSVLESTLLPGRKVIPTLHPATIIPPKNVYLNKRLIINDLIRAKGQSEFPEIRVTQRIVAIEPSFSDCITFLNLCKENGLQGKVIYFDIEVFNNEISCISFSFGEHLAISIPFLNSSGPYFTPDQEQIIWLRIAEILEDPKIRKGGQNLTFDASILLTQFGIKTRNVKVDTMINEKIILPDYPAGLDFITSMFTDIPYYKAEGKRWYKVGGAWRELWHYNGLDSIACSSAAPEQWKNIIKQQNERTVERQTKVIEPLLYMTQRGIKVDIEGMKKAKVEMDEEATILQNKLNSIAGCELNPNSPKQLLHYFYTNLGHKPYLKGGRPTTDETALTRLARKGVEEAKLIKRIRHLIKLSSTYVNLDKVSDDGRLRCFYNPAGTRTGRLSSGEDIFGKGMNLQNWPHSLLRYLLIDEGYVGYFFDLSQAENRIVAYIGKVARMIRAFENEEDVHRLTAALIFGKDPSEISDEEGSSSLGGGLQSERFWGKKTNHSLDYDLGYRKFSLQCEITENEGKWLVERWHSIYPEIRGTFHQNIRLQLAKDRTITNLMRRRRMFLDRWGDDLFKAAYAQIPQSTVADKINEQGLNYVYYSQGFNEVELLSQVHDSIGFQIPLSVPWITHARILLDIKESLETPLTTNEVEFVVPADLVMGLNFFKGDGVEFKHNKIPTTIKELSEKLEKSYNELVKKRGLNDSTKTPCTELVGGLS